VGGLAVILQLQVLRVVEVGQALAGDLAVGSKGGGSGYQGVDWSERWCRAVQLSRCGLGKNIE
jgi:hypothetical protein